MEHISKLHEECGVFGIYRRGGEGVVGETYHALYALQHRGQESCGMAVNNDGVISCYKDVGLVTDVFTRDVLEKIHDGTIAVGHCRYGTKNTVNRDNAQPLVVSHHKGGMALCHNGALTNAVDLREQMEAKGAIFLRADGHGVPELLDAILQVFPLDTYVEQPAILMEKMECDKDLTIPVWDEYKEIIAKYDERGAEAVGNIDRFKFYDEAKDCYCILQTGETAIYANIILQKGVIK